MFELAFLANGNKESVLILHWHGFIVPCLAEKILVSLCSNSSPETGNSFFHSISSLAGQLPQPSLCCRLWYHRYQHLQTASNRWW